MQVDEERASPRIQTEGDEVVMGIPVADSGQREGQNSNGAAMNLEDIGVDFAQVYESE